MAILDVGYEAVVPANSSRFFETRTEAVGQPTARVRLAVREDDPFIFNSEFDADLLRHDGAYCTSVADLSRKIVLPTLNYFGSSILPRLRPAPTIVDIGCGQGEFVSALDQLGVEAIGYDPVLLEDGPRLHKRYWTPAEPPADLFVMRCVLPHIAGPWEFLDSIAMCSPGSLVLLEYQRLEWITTRKVWYQVSHDHVNLFRASDFSDRYRVIDEGTFSGGEWAWCLLDPTRVNTRPAGIDEATKESFRRLMDARQFSLLAATSIDRPLAIWGAAGKGIVLAAALAESALDLTAIDADPKRWSRYLEVSGIRVLSPRDAMETLPKDAVILVANPNHLNDVRRFVNDRWRVILLSQLTLGGSALPPSDA